MHLGVGTGLTTFLVAKHFKKVQNHLSQHTVFCCFFSLDLPFNFNVLTSQVLGQDFCARFIDLCQQLQRDKRLTIDIIEGLKRSRKEVMLPDDAQGQNILFKQVWLDTSCLIAHKLIIYIISCFLAAHVALKRDRLLWRYHEHVFWPRHEPGSVGASSVGSGQRRWPLRRRVQSLKRWEWSGGSSCDEVGPCLCQSLLPLPFLFLPVLLLFRLKLPFNGGKRCRVRAIRKEAERVRHCLEKNLSPRTLTLRHWSS